MKSIYRIQLMISLMMLIYLKSTCQEYQYFSTRLDLNGLNDVDRCQSIVEVADGYIVAGHSIERSGNMYWWKEVIAKIDFEGQIQTIKFYGEDSIDYFFNPFPGFMINDGDNTYAVGKIRTLTPIGLHDEGTLICFDQNLDTLWSKRYGEKTEPYDTVYLFESIQKIDQHHLIITGAWKPNGLPTHVYLFKTDSIGQIIWENSYTYYNYYIEGTSVAQTSDQGFILGCFKQTPGYPESTDPVIIKTDSLGNQEWTKNLGGQYKDNKAIVCTSLDSMILVGTNYADSMYTPDISYSKINIIKVDNQGNIIWNKKYGASRLHNFLLNIRELNDSSIIAVGSVRTYNPYQYWVGWILKTKPNGDSLWYREYLILPGEESSNSLYDVILTSDNGLIACGYVDPSEPDTGSIDTWVIKLDSIGCEWAGCDTTVGIEEPGSGEVGKPGGQGDKGTGRGLEIWPNPAREILNFKFSILNSGRDYSISIYDIFGRIMLSSTPIFPQSMGTKVKWQINVESLPPGVYIAILKNGPDIIESQKFVVAR